MKEPFSILQIGFGSIGKMLAEKIVERENLTLESIIDVNPAVIGKSLSDFSYVTEKQDVTIVGDFEEALRTIPLGRPDLALILTSSSLVDVAPLLKKCLETKMNVISICEELSYPYSANSTIANNIDSLAKNAKKSVLGTGINPGFLMDLLPIILTSPTTSFEKMKITRVIDSTKRRHSFQKKIGTGMSVTEFEAAIEEEKITGHVGLIESIHLINDGLRLQLDNIRELAPEAITSDRAFETPIGPVEKGQVKGLRSTGQGIKNERVVVELLFEAYCNATPEYDEVSIHGKPEVHQRIEGGVMGDYGTIGMMLNMIPLVMSAEPGLHTNIDLPCPRNTENYWKHEREDDLNVREI